MRATRWGRSSSAAGLAAAIVGGAALAGCQHDSPQETRPTASTTQSGTLARYSGLASACPTLSSEAATELGAYGEGHSTNDERAVPGLTHIECRWRPEDVRPSVYVVISIHPDGFAPTQTGQGNARRSFDSLREEEKKDDSAGASTTARQSPWGPAFVTAYAPLATARQTTLIDNVVVTVVISDEERFPEDVSAERDRLARQFGPALNILTGEVVDDLR